MKASIISWALCLLAVSQAQAAAPIHFKISSGRSVIPKRYIVEIAPGAGNPSHIFQAAASTKGHSITIHHEYTSPVFSGVSVEFENAANIQEYIDHGDVKAIWPVHSVPGPKPIKNYQPKTGTKSAPYNDHTLTGVNQVHQMGITGKGVKVGVIDTGIYWKHPAFGSCFKTKGCRVAYGFDFVGDGYNATNPVAVPDPDPFDNCSDGHGTHTAGIVGANALHIKNPAPVVPFTGVAPDATLGAYRVFGCAADTTSTDIIIQALLYAANDGMNIISMSLGANADWSEEVDANIASRLTDQGHLVVIAMGNNGGNGFFLGGDPATTVDGFSIGSVDNLETIEYVITDAENNQYGYSYGALYGAPFPNITKQIIVNDYTYSPDDGCTSLNVDPTGKVIIFALGSACGTKVQCGLAREKGAVGCLVYNDVPGTASINGDSQIPSGGLDPQDGAAILAQVKKNPTQNFFFSSSQSTFGVYSGGTPSSFTSNSLTAELLIKPDISAIGGFVYSTLPAIRNYYGIDSGTSMATPYFAGSLALYIQARGIQTGSFMKTVFQNNAKPRNDYQSEYPSHVAIQGAGLVNVYDTIMSHSWVSPSSLSLNDTVHTKPNYKITIYNNNKQPITYKLTNAPTRTAIEFAKGNTMMLNDPDYVEDFATVKFSRSLVTVGPHSSVAIEVKFTAPPKSPASLIPFFSGYLVFTPTKPGKGNTPMVVPYAGAKGSWYTAPVFNTIDPLGGITFGVLNPQGEFINSTTQYNFSDPSQPVTIILPMSTPVRIVKTELIPVGKGKESLGYLYGNSPDFGAGVLYYTYLPRNCETANPNGCQQYFTLVWQGDLVNDPSNTIYQTIAPAGKYFIRVSGLKHFGDPAKAADWVVVDTHEIHVIY
ncbi:peptidase S8/S53 domain-containing protein [Endogone sp. FLAS-F59071]|nr:peptidase S8/S53 domain-containing protein [Endogone sp. FLAS-F59071]|eukprot:RUS18771.1 peptidase S8/S53 domain-containing protein [Endogone sp. FLAS-F59071]